VAKPLERCGRCSPFGVVDDKSLFPVEHGVGERGVGAHARSIRFAAVALALGHLRIHTGKERAGVKSPALFLSRILVQNA